MGFWDRRFAAGAVFAASFICREYRGITGGLRRELPGNHLRILACLFHGSFLTVVSRLSDRRIRRGMESLWENTWKR